MAGNVSAADGPLMHSRLLPEWADCETVLLAWPSPDGDWGPNFDAVDKCYFLITQALSAKVSLIILLSPSLSENAWRDRALENNINLSNCRVITHIKYNDTWVRDYAPLSRDNGLVNFSFNAWGEKYPFDDDNRVSGELSKSLNLTIDNISLVLEGGAIEVNGQSMALLNTECIIDDKRNAGFEKAQVEQALSRALGFQYFFWLNGIKLSGDDTDGHIDTLARFIDNKTIVHAGENAAHPDTATLERLATQLKVIASKHELELIALPTPEYRSAVDGRLLPATYVNFLYAGKCVFVPNYGVIEDESVNEIFRRLSRDRFDVVPVSCEALLEQNGSLHCATMQFAAASLKAAQLN